MTQKNNFSVLIIDNFHHDPKYDYTIEGFPTEELAIEFARCYVRDSVENKRKSDQSKQELKKLWLSYGEDAIVLDSDYKGSSELDFFIDHPATPEEINWQRIKVEANII